MSVSGQPQLIYRGSVKDLYKEGDNYNFVYSDRYSIFDWGEMPNPIPQKGEALNQIAVAFFEYLRHQGFDSHFVRKISANSFQARPVQVIRPALLSDSQSGQYDYSCYQSFPEDSLVPLEVIFRYQLGQGNSLATRVAQNKQFAIDLNLNEKEIEEAVLTQRVFDPPLVEFSTKLESTDRYLTRQNIQEMHFCSEAEINRIRKETQAIANQLKYLFNSIGVDLIDGKLEFAFGKRKANGERNLFLVDSIGPDELRLIYKGLPLSKEFLRQVYLNTSWYKSVVESKSIAKSRGTTDWKSICTKEKKSFPDPLSSDQVSVVSDLYTTLASAITMATNAVINNKSTPFKNENSDAAQILNTWLEKAKKAMGLTI